jgi:xanthine dehydrogenase accessory factor
MSVPDAASSQSLRCWLAALMRALQREPVIVRIVLATVRGSAPREAGVSMLVAPRALEGTIGGGQLEWEAVAAARALLEEAAGPARLQRIVLGADRGQCCGGVVDVWMERYTRAELALLETARLAAQRGAVVLCSMIGHTGMERRLVCSQGDNREASLLLRTPRAQALPRLQHGPRGEVALLERLDDPLPPLWLYGAGHVGQALARILMELPLSLTWIDSRAAQFPAQIPDSVRVLPSTDPVESVATAPSGTRFLVMTHSHPLDYALCRAILGRGDFAWAGLIGSLSKAARFRSRLARNGVAAEAIARLVCPIGIGGIASKWPAAIAVGVATQIMQDISVVLDAGGHPPEARETETTCAQGICAGCGSVAAETA